MKLFADSTMSCSRAAGLRPVSRKSARRRSSLPRASRSHSRRNAAGSTARSANRSAPAMTGFEEIGAAVGCLTALTRPEHARAVPRDERGGPRGDLAALGAADPLEVSGRSPAARADPHELLDNALKYTPAGGREEMS